MVSLAGCARKPLSFVVLETTDLHGAYVTEFSGGSGYIRKLQQEYGDRLLLLDCGDNLHGTPEVYYSNFRDTVHTHIFSEYANWAGYSALAVGNHDVEAGRNVYDRVYSKVNMPVLCANAVDSRTGEPYFQPYHFFTIKGCKIAVLGLLWPSAVDWISLDDMDNLTVEPMAASAEKWVKIIRETENPDVLIGLFHAGQEETGEIAREIPGFDLICCGHAHNATELQEVSAAGDTVKIMEAGAKGSHVARADITVTFVPGGKKPKVEVSTELVAATNLPDYYEYDAPYEAFMHRLEQYMNFPVCVLKENVYSKDAMYGPSAWVDEIHQAVFDILNQYVPDLGVDVSFVSPASRNLRVEKGVMTPREFITYYPYENKLVVMKMTGGEILRFLEYSYMLRLDHPEGPAYHFDSAAGIIYNVYRERPYGKRVEILSMADGRPFDTTATYHAAMTEFRSQGGGGHMVNGVGWNKQTMQERMLWKSDKDMRQMLVLRASLSSPVNFKPLNQWRYL